MTTLKDVQNYFFDCKELLLEKLFQFTQNQLVCHCSALNRRNEVSVKSPGVTLHPADVQGTAQNHTDPQRRHSGSKGVGFLRCCQLSPLSFFLLFARRMSSLGYSPLYFENTQLFRFHRFTTGREFSVCIMPPASCTSNLHDSQLRLQTVTLMLE